MASIKLLCEAGEWIDKPITSIQTTSLGWIRKKLLLRGSIIKGEDARKGPEIYWFGIYCPTIIGYVRGIIYKVAITVTAIRGSPYGFFEFVSDEISDTLDIKPTDSQNGIMIWDAEDGNVVLQEIFNDSLPTVMIFITSNTIP